MINNSNVLNPFKYLKNDIPASIVVFLVAMPLCLGIALVSGAPLLSGIISGIIGGIVVGALSGSALGVSGPAAGLAVIVLNAITDLGSFDIFLVAVIIAGVIQVILGFAKAGFIAYFFPSSVIHGMLAGIGIIIFLKQIPHVLGYDKDPEGDFEFFQMDKHNTLEDLWISLNNVSYGVVVIAAIALLILILWDAPFIKKMKFTKVLPGPLVAVIVGILLAKMFESIPELMISKEHFVNVPVANSAEEFLGNFRFPDFTAFANPKVYVVGLVIAIVASLETLLCVEATDKQDDLKRVTPTNLELKAQGVGNILAGFIGGIPVTQVIVRSSANKQAGGKTKMATIIHGVLLLISIAAIPSVLNMIPFAVLASILLVVGFKLAKPELFKKMYKEGMGQFAPFMVTILGILFIDLLGGIALGLSVAIFIVLKNNLTIPFKILKSKVLANKKVKMVLSQDVTFLNKAAILTSLASIPDGGKVIIDASNTHFIHYDVLEIFEDFETNAHSRNITVEKIGFENINSTNNLQHFEIQLEDAKTKELQEKMTPNQALEMLIEGNKRFINSKALQRDYQFQIDQTSAGQYPFAVILSCIDSRVPAELVFDQGIGDLFSVRVAGNVVNEDVLGSMEYGCKVAGSKIILVLGHTKCGAVNAACKNVELGNITPLLSKIQPAVIEVKKDKEELSEEDIYEVEKVNVQNSIVSIRKQSPILAEMEKNGEILIKGAVYNVSSGEIIFCDEALN